MDFTPTPDSSLIKGISHQEDTLTVFFHSNRNYQFQGVPESLARHLLDSESAGRFFHKFIKPNFSSSEVTEK